MDGCRPSIVQSADLTIAELCQRYRKYAESYYTRCAMTYNIASACHTLRERYHSTLASEFGPLTLKAVRRQFVDAGHSRTYCNRLQCFDAQC
ncbi:MAG TPA: hypothetical protein VGJ04_07750 [Pirellulales bacterium]